MYYNGIKTHWIRSSWAFMLLAIYENTLFWTNQLLALAFCHTTVLALMVISSIYSISKMLISEWRRFFIKETTQTSDPVPRKIIKKTTLDRCLMEIRRHLSPIKTYQIENCICISQSTRNVRMVWYVYICRTDKHRRKKFPLYNILG